MAMFSLIEYENASPEVRAIYDDIRATRKANGYRIDVDERFREPLSL